MPHIETLDLAESWFGPPTSSQVISGGTPSSPPMPASRAEQSAEAVVNTADVPISPPTPAGRYTRAKAAVNATGGPAPAQTVAGRLGRADADAAVLPPGTRIEYEWLLDDVITVPGQDVVERFLVGNDRQGFPVYYERIRWVPAHPARRFCRVRMLADTQGRILSRSVEGNDCEDLLIRPSMY
jgi:hypothetical protein